MVEKDDLTVRPRAPRWALVLAAALLVAVVLTVWLATRASEAGSQEASEPAVVEPIAGSELKRVRLTERAVERLGLRTSSVRMASGQTVVPYSALLYDAEGATWVFTSPERLAFVRAPVRVERIEGQSAFLAAGPRLGTAVVSVGAAELYGAELGVDH
jgi:hypothetical protein